LLNLLLDLWDDRCWFFAWVSHLARPLFFGRAQMRRQVFRWLWMYPKMKHDASSTSNWAAVLAVGCDGIGPDSPKKRFQRIAFPNRQESTRRKRLFTG
jgi:hypothetical protein